jgi:chromosome segregation ATPase
MKKPFFKKTSGYLERIQAEYDALKSQHDEAKKALAIAATDYDAKAKASRELEAKSPANTYLSDAESRLRRLRDDAESIHRQAGYKVYDLERDMQPLATILNAPGSLADAKTTLNEMNGCEAVLKADFEKTAHQFEKVQQRIADLEQQIATETKSACQVMAESEEEFAVPDSLGKLDVALRLAKATLGELQARVERIQQERGEISDKVKAAKQTIVHMRARVAEIELHEQLPGFIDIIARAAVSSHLSNFGNKADRYEITIPREVVNSMTEQLNAELAT